MCVTRNFFIIRQTSLAKSAARKIPATQIAGFRHTLSHRRTFFVKLIEVKFLFHASLDMYAEVSGANTIIFALPNGGEFTIAMKINMR